MRTHVQRFKSSFHSFLKSKIVKNFQMKMVTRNSNSDSRLFSDLTSDERLSHYSFWKERYKQKESESFDWFMDSKLLYESINFHLQDLHSKNPNEPLRYLEVGCGTSELPLSIFRRSSFPVCVLAMDYVLDAACHQIAMSTNVSPKNNESHFQAVCGDVTKLPFRPESCDIVVDKGTMDALLKDRLNGSQNSSLMLSQAMRCLRLGGRFIHISDEDPDSRLHFLESLSKFNEIGDKNAYDHPVFSSDNQSHSQREVFSFTPWNFKVLTNDLIDMEYFMYWTKKR